MDHFKEHSLVRWRWKTIKRDCVNYILNQLPVMNTVKLIGSPSKILTEMSENIHSIVSWMKGDKYP